MKKLNAVLSVFAISALIPQTIDAKELSNKKKIKVVQEQKDIKQKEKKAAADVKNKKLSEVETFENFVSNKIKEMKGQEVFKADHKTLFRDDIVNILSIAFNTQDSIKNSRDAMKTAMRKIDESKTNNELRANYIMAYNALQSFLENLSEPEVYKKYVEMIDTTDEVFNIADAFTWMASSMEKLIKYGYSDITMQHIVNRKFIFRHIYLLSKIEIFSNLYYEQRQFLLKMFEWCEQIMHVSLIGNGPGFEDGIDWWVNDTAIFFEKARIFDLEMNKIFDNINNSFKISKLKNKEDVQNSITFLNDVIKNAYLNKIDVRETQISPTRTMIFEICQKAQIGKKILEYMKKELEAKEKITYPEKAY